MSKPIEKDLILKMTHIKEQKNGINDINDAKLLDVIKQSSLLRLCFSCSNHPSILSLL